MPTRTFLPLDGERLTVVFKLFLSCLGAFGEGTGFGFEGLGEIHGAQHAWLVVKGEAKGSGEKDNLLQLPCRQLSQWGQE